MTLTHGIKQVEEILLSFYDSISLSKKAKGKIFFSINRIKTIAITFNMRSTFSFHLSIFVLLSDSSIF